VACVVVAVVGVVVVRDLYGACFVSFRFLFLWVGVFLQLEDRIFLTLRLCVLAIVAASPDVARCTLLLFFFN